MEIRYYIGRVLKITVELPNSVCFFSKAVNRGRVIATLGGPGEVWRLMGKINVLLLIGCVELMAPHYFGD